MFWFKLCPRCTGDLFEDPDQSKAFIACMQCGLTKDVPGEHSGLLIATAEPVPVPVALVSSGVTRRHISKTVAFDPEEIAESAA